MIRSEHEIVQDKHAFYRLHGADPDKWDDATVDAWLDMVDGPETTDA